MDYIDKFKNLSIKDLKATSTMGGIFVKMQDPELDIIWSKLCKKYLGVKYPTVNLSAGNRIDIDGIPAPLRGLGIGRLIYELMVSKYGYIRSVKSYNSRSEDANRLWASLKKQSIYPYISFGIQDILFRRDNFDKVIPIVKSIVKANGLGEEEFEDILETNIPKNKINFLINTIFPK